MIKFIVVCSVAAIFCVNLTCMHAYSPYAIHSGGTKSSLSDIGLYGYDTAGNRLTKTVQGQIDRNQTFAYGLIGKAVSIKQGAKTSSIKHAPGGRRYLRLDDDGHNRTKTLYLSGVEYKINANGKASSTIRIHAKGYSSVAQVEMSDSSTDYTYLIQDHLGSPVVSVGATQTHNRYDAWGQKTEATGVAKTLTVDDEKTSRYTGHELMAFANMGQWNARLFDYEIGMFPQADTFIQGRTIAALNRYAPGHNTGPNFTDSTGYTVEAINVKPPLSIFGHMPVRKQAQIIVDNILSDSDTSHALNVNIRNRMLHAINNGNHTLYLRYNNKDNLYITHNGIKYFNTKALESKGMFSGGIRPGSTAKAFPLPRNELDATGFEFSVVERDGRVFFEATPPPAAAAAPTARSVVDEIRPDMPITFDHNNQPILPDEPVAKRRATSPSAVTATAHPPGRHSPGADAYLDLLDAGRHSPGADVYLDLLDNDAPDRHSPLGDLNFNE